MEDLYALHTELTLLADWHFQRTDLKCNLPIIPNSKTWWDHTQYCPWCMAYDEILSCRETIYKKLCEDFGIECDDECKF